MLADPDGYAQRLKEQLIFNRGLVTPGAAPAPILLELSLPLKGDHPQAVEGSRQCLGDELQHVKRRPTAWRWALVTLWNALAHPLATHRPAGVRPCTRTA